MKKTRAPSTKEVASQAVNPPVTDPNSAPHRQVMERLGLEVPAIASSPPSVTELLDVLRATYRHLLDVSDDDIMAMDEADRTAWLRTGDELFQDIRILEINELAQLNSDFTARLPELQDATARLKKSFETLNNVVAAIKATAQVLKIVTDIVSLLK
jgi:hypothetical protein